MNTKSLKSNVLNIGLIRLSAIGDVVLCVPLVRSLQAHFPKAKITWITSPAAYSILEGLSGVEFVLVDKPRNLGSYLKQIPKLKHLSFDVLFCLQASFSVNILYPWIKARRRIGFDKSRARDLHRFFINEKIAEGRDHFIDAYLRFAQVLDPKIPKKYEWDLAIPNKDILWVENQFLNKKIIVINPMASKQERCWQTERYIKLLEKIHARDANQEIAIVLTGGTGEKEKALAKQIETALDFKIYNWVGKTSLKRLAALFSRACLLVSPDTGPLHIATAVGLPTVGLYAVASSNLSGPYFSKNLTIDKFDEAVKVFLNKEASTLPWLTRVHTQEAMALISVDEVFLKVSEIVFAL